jgi:Ala-tRNA(Pro) deacylase
MRIDEFLTSQKVPFQRLPHRPAYTANRVAQALHVPGQDMAKAVLVRAGQGYALAVLPATHRVDLDRLRQELGEPQVGLASEGEMERLFPDCERGVVPPFGSLYHLPTLVDEALAADEEIVFEGQNHEEAIRMTYRDYTAVEHPRLGHFACRA